MKNIALISTIIFMLVFILSSCKKEYKCKCTYDDGTNTGEAVYTLKEKKKEAGARCDAYEVAVNSTTTWSCEVQ